MSKTFKSVTDNKSELDVRANDCGVFIAFSRAGQIRQASTFAPSDAPALALAILEAAGVEAEWQMSWEDGSDEQLKRVATDLAKHVQVTESRATAEAKEQAELEAEALELANSAVLVVRNPPYLSIRHMSATSLRKWLAVARKAREMRKP